MASSESVTEQFSTFGIDIDNNVLHKCVDLCISSGLDAETFVEQWMAFSISHHNGAAPTVDLLELMERKELSRKSSVFPKSPKSEQIHSLYQDGNIAEFNEDNVLADYCTTPKSKRENQKYITPKSSRLRVQGTPIASLSPATHSPNICQSCEYSTRSNSGDVVSSFGDASKLESCSWTNTLGELCKIQQIPNENGTILTNTAMYGFELLQEKASFLDNNIKYLSQHILHKAGINETVSVKYKSQIPVAVVGRIDCDANGRLNSKSVLLQGSWKDSMGRATPLDLDQLKQYSLFPGQIVVMKGLNIRGDKFAPQEVFYDASYGKPNKIDIEEAIHGNLQMVVACGPFTTSDSLTYDPLTDLIIYVTENKPHALLLIGPFLDASHQMVVDNTIAETFKSYFEKMVDKIMAAVESASPFTQVIIASSAKDVFHTDIYPTPSFSIRKSYANLTLIPDPCCINVGGVTVGVTSADILMHLSKEEISSTLQGPDRLGRLASHLLYQKNFYPLFPPNPSLAEDTALWSEHAHMTSTPHILVIPSDLRYYIKDINGCLVVNPERLTKGVGGGTFARIQVNANTSPDEFLCQILRV